MTHHSDRLNKLAVALSRAQAQIEPARADAVGALDDGLDPRTYRYATLASVWHAIRGVLTHNGLSVVQTCEPGEASELRLVTTLLHTSGQWISGTTVMPLGTQTPQAYGSALTYARRYGLAAMVGLCVDPDDDAGSASRPLDETGRSDDRRHHAAAGGDAALPWWKVRCNQADSAHWTAFARAYARSRGLDSVDEDDVRRDLGIEGSLADHFGDATLGEIMARTRVRRTRRAPANTPAPSPARPAQDADAA